MVSSIKDIIPKVASELGTTKTEAEKTIKTVLNCMVGEVKENGGFCYKGQFTLKQSFKKSRTGSIVRKDSKTGEKTKKDYVSPEYMSLKVTIGADLKSELNPNLNN